MFCTKHTLIYSQCLEIVFQRLGVIALIGVNCADVVVRRRSLFTFKAIDLLGEGNLAKIYLLGVLIMGIFPQEICICKQELGIIFLFVVAALSPIVCLGVYGGHTGDAVGDGDIDVGNDCLSLE